MMPKIWGCVKTCEVEDKKSKLMLFGIYDEKVLEKYKTIWTKIEDLKKFKFFFSFFMMIDGNKVYTNFWGLNVPEDDIKWETFTAISIDSLLVYHSNYCLQVYLDKFGYKIASKQFWRLDLTNFALG